ncbi:MAG: nickel pincer cofactor biosynthesis protein LarC [Desulfobulbus sp.]|jgi:uncharacterized protein (TIGR00299 family) protein
MIRLAYLDCFSGVAGDMLLAALLDAGASEEAVRKAVQVLPGLELTVRRDTVCGFAATRVQVHDPAARKHHHHHHRDQQHGQHHGHHPHRHLSDIALLLAQAELSTTVRTRALAVFTRLAEAEAAVHGTEVETVHFHEVGAVDAIADIVGVVAACESLAIDRLVVSPLPMPRGWVRCDHGEIPLPAPAVCALLHGVPVEGVDLRQELVTPTGAALVRELADSFGPLPSMTLEHTGYGAGSNERADGRPNLLRVLIGRAEETIRESQVVTVLETHLDDWNPEFWPHLSKRLMAAGALDVCLIPIQMKKGRPGFLLRVLTDPADESTVVPIVFAETTTLGLRRRLEQRITLPRAEIRVDTPWGEVRAKRVGAADSGTIAPEYEACRQLALDHGVPLREVYAAVRAGLSRADDK